MVGANIHDAPETLSDYIAKSCTKTLLNQKHAAVSILYCVPERPPRTSVVTCHKYVISQHVYEGNVDRIHIHDGQEPLYNPMTTTAYIVSFVSWNDQNG